MKKIRLIVCVLFIAILANRPAYGGENDKTDAPWERFYLRAGGLLAALDGNIRIGTALGVGADFDVEDALGLNSGLSSFRVDAMYRFGGHRRSRADLSWFNLRRDATKVLQRDITINDRTFTAGSTIDSLLDIQIIRASYSYSLIRDERFDLSVGGGFYIMPIKFRANVSGTSDSQGETITAPLPVFNFRFDFALTPKWFIRQNIDFFYLQVGDFKGGLMDITAAVEYNPWKHFGFGLGFDFFRVGIEAEGDDLPGVDLNGNIKFNLSSIIFYARYFF